MTKNTPATSNMLEKKSGVFKVGNISLGSDAGAIVSWLNGALGSPILIERLWLKISREGDIVDLEVYGDTGDVTHTATCSARQMLTVLL